MKIGMYKKFIIWICLGFYLLLGAGNLSAVAFCSGSDNHIGLNILGFESCCSDLINNLEENAIFNVQSCNECQDFFVKAKNLNQTITYNQNQLNDIIADISDFNAIEIDFNVTENNIFLPDYKPIACNNLNALKTVVLII
ncbi:MAG TPA: hypothetical protein P5556_00555 [Candidatus Gastranaerophilales bacterium]|nr:hypothetical protein [Candidatus Gastranaerophilales bacterium]